jgi:hypothetical protein
MQMHQINSNIKIIKLINGDDIVCELPTGDKQLPENGPLLRMIKPLHIKYIPQFTPQGFKDYIALTKWAAYTPDHIVTIPKDKIMTVTNASPEMSRSWVNISANYNLESHRPATNVEKIKFSDEDNERLNEIFDDYGKDEEEDEPTLH